MKYIEDADRYVSQSHLSPEAALRLASRIDKARAEAARSDQGLFEVARERLLAHLLSVAAEEVRIAPAREGAHLVEVRPPRGRRAPRAVIGLDRLPAAVRESLDLSVEAGEEEAVPGLDVRPVDAAHRAALTGLSAGQCRKAGLEAEEAYDYDRALAAYRLAVVRSGGDLAMVRELVRFLGEIYADYDEMGELLSSSAIDVDRDRELHLRLANASFQLGHHDEALEHYEALRRGEADSFIEQRLGGALVALGRPDEALRHLEAALKMDNGNTEARRLLDKAREALAGEADTLFQKAQAAFDAGDVSQARAICDTLSERGLKHAGADRLRARLDEQAQRAQAEVHLAEAQRLADAGSWREASDAIRAARQCDADVLGGAESLVTTVERELAAEQCAGHLQVATAREADGDLVGALMSLARALDTGAPLDDAVLEAPLMARLRRFEARQGTDRRPTERQFEGLAALHRADAAFTAGDPRAAEAALKDARRYLKGDAEVEGLLGRMDQLRADERSSRVTALIDEGEQLRESGDLRGALRAVEKAIDLGPDRAAALEPVRRELKAAIKMAQHEDRLCGQLERLAADDAWWRVRRAVRQSGMDTPRLTQWADTASSAIEARWALSALEVPVAGGEALELSAFGFDEGYLKRIVIHLDEAAGRYLVGVDDRLAFVDADTLSPTAIFGLPAGLRIQRATVRLFGFDGGVAIFDAAERAVTLLRDAGSGLAVDDRYELTRALSGAEDDKRLAAETQLDPATGRWLFLLTDASGRYDSRLLSVGVEDGQQHGEERLQGTAFNLRRVHGTDHFTVQKLLQLHRLTPSACNFVVVDGRAKVYEKPLYADLMEPMHAIRRVATIPHEAGLLAHYWFSEPFTGRVIEQSNGMLQAREDWSIFYQSSRPEDWLGTERAPAGTFAVHEASGRVVLPWRSTIKGDKTTGLSMLSTEQWREQASVELDDGDSLIRLFEDRGRGAVLALVATGGQGSLRRVDPENGTLS